MRHFSNVAFLVVPFVVGCFSLQPVDRLQPKTGAEIAVDLNDAGRTALTPTLGPDVAQVHGHLLRRDGGEDVLAITSSEFLRGGARTWSGETLHVRSDYASRYYESRVSKSRTFIAGGLIAAGVAAMAIQGLSDTPGPQPGSGTIDQPGEKLRARPRAALRFSTSASTSARAMRLVLPFFTKH